MDDLPQSSIQFGCSVEWSEKDGVWIASSSQFPDMKAHGTTPWEAFLELKTAILAVIDEEIIH